jgi:hypothetical protein
LARRLQEAAIMPLLRYNPLAQRGIDDLPQAAGSTARMGRKAESDNREEKRTEGRKRRANW